MITKFFRSILQVAGRAKNKIALSNCSIMRQMSRYYRLHNKGAEICVRPSNSWRKALLLRNIPNLTGDFVPIDIFIKGKFDTSVKYIKVLYEYDERKYDESPQYSPDEHKYTFRGKRLSDAGSYKARLLIATDIPEVQERLWQSQPEIALIQVIDDWKPTVWLLGFVIAAVLGIIVGIITAI